MQIKVTVIEQGGQVKPDMVVSDDATVAEVIRQAGVNTTRSKEVRRNGSVASMSDTVRNNDVIQVIPNIEGGSR